MKSPVFDYVAPHSLAEVVQSLDEDPEARPISGGQSLLPILGIRLSAPTTLVDLMNVAELSGISTEGDRTLIGATTRQSAIEVSAELAERFPALVEAVRNIGYPAIRNRGTIGGSLAHADPAAELPLMMTALDASIRVIGREGIRRVPATEFFLGPFDTALHEGEIVATIDLPPTELDWTFLELTRRRADFAIAMVAVGVRMEGFQCEDVRIHVGASHPTPLRLASVEDGLRGTEVSAASIRTAAELAGEQVRPAADIHGSESYRRRVTTALVGRALREAMRVSA